MGRQLGRSPTAALVAFGGHRGYQILTAATRDQPESQSALCQGRSRLEELDLRLSHAEAHVLSGLSASDRETFRALLCRLAGHVNELDPVPSACQAVQDISASTT